jgi:hypothetical protein
MARIYLGFIGDSFRIAASQESQQPQVSEPCLHPGSARAALISLLSLSTISAGAFLGVPMPYQPLFS